MDKKTQQLEALLFVAGEGVSKRELAKILDISEVGLDTLVQQMREELAGRGLALVVTEKDVELTTSPDVREFLAVYLESENEPLSRAGAETLAVVAYKGPLTRYDIDMIRGVDSRRMLRHLIQRGVVRRLAGQGRAPLYDVTEEFLKQLGITRREELPNFGLEAGYESS